MSLSKLEEAARPFHLAVFGVCAALPEDWVGAGTLALLGPGEPGFWSYVSASPEFSDGAPDPLDRWSARVITDIALAMGARPFFPFGDPVRPFIGWALRSGRAWTSPVGLLIHDEAGLMVSYRGAVLLEDTFVLPAQRTSPCEACLDRPCIAACPVDALSGHGYRLDACHRYLDTHGGEDCMTKGCAVRRACPVSRSHGRQHAQSAFHMAQFHP